ncbi:MAG: homoserine O-acetyltransferase [Xanthomonadales bacterium]|nr:Homoserine O-acetyltransferase [Xanthomonadales bacterium]MCC6592594.1 homoserine O-acetyltransferase [Xanthomonadales bacterium]MCE7932618.1 homoserine O-acetyltransferase [Xanthomonadales bacterium PRO6]
MAHPCHTPVAIRSHTPAAPLPLERGGEIAHATVAFQTWGALNAARDNAIWVCHALTASSDVETWWSGVFGPGRLLDPTRHYIVCANVLGGCYGSAGPASIDPASGERRGARFPAITIGDLVEHQRRLADHLRIAAIELVVGASMGGFQALEWARRDGRVRRLALLATSWRQPPQALAQASLQCEFIRRDPKFRGGDYAQDDGPTEGLALARQLGHLTYRSARELDLRFGRARRADGRYQVLSYLDHQGDKLVRRFDANSYLRLTEAMNEYDCAAGGDPESALAALTLPTLVVALDSDQLYYPGEQHRLARALPRGRLVEFETVWGHDGFLVDAARLDPLLCAFRDEPLPEANVTRLPARAGTRRPRIPTVLLGATGRVGGALLELLAQPGCEAPLQLVGVANSRAALWQAEGLAPGLAAERLRAHSAGSVAGLLEQLRAQPRPALLIDCSADAVAAAHALRLLEDGVALVTPNKLGFAAAQSDYARIRAALAHTPAAWSATVGAGLPALATIRRLRAAGDRLLGIEATLSGTLGHLLTRVQEGASLRRALAEAITLGLAEPDPRADLGGEDVRRKLVILLREAGIPIEPQAVAHAPLLRCASELPWDEAVGLHEHDWLALVADAARAGTRLVYRAAWTPQEGAQVGLALLAATHPLAGARGVENRIVLRSERHAELPIMIAGAGAGVRITAAAVLADAVEVATRLLAAEPRAEAFRLSAAL